MLPTELDGNVILVMEEVMRQGMMKLEMSQNSGKYESVASTTGVRNRGYADC